MEVSFISAATIPIFAAIFIIDDTIHNLRLQFPKGPDFKVFPKLVN